MGRHKRQELETSLVGSLLLLSFMVLSAEAATFNITAILDEFPDLNILSQLLCDTKVADDINVRTSLTLLAPSNDAMTAFRSANPGVKGEKVGDLLRYHVLLQFLTVPDLQGLDMTNYTAVTTLYSTTGRASDDGIVKFYNSPSKILVGHSVLDDYPNSTVVNSTFQQPFEISVIMIDRTLLPVGFETPFGGANLTGALQDLGGYNVFVGLLKQTGVDLVFAGRQQGDGITIFVPTDEAFDILPAQWFENFELKEQKLLLEYHALTRYNSMGALWRFDNKEVPTVSSTVEGPDVYNLLVTAKKGVVTIFSSTPDKPVATLTSTLYDSPPVVMYSVDAVLLPVELFLDVMAVPLTPPAPPAVLTPAPAPAPTPAPVPAPAPPLPKRILPVPAAPPPPPAATKASAASVASADLPLALALLYTSVFVFAFGPEEFPRI